MEAQPIDPMSLGLLIYRAHQLARAKANEAARPLGIELHHAVVLSTVKDGQIRSQRELGATLGIDKSTLVRIVDYLEQQRLLERRRVPNDRRTYEIVITGRGEQRLQESGELFQRAMLELLEVFTVEEQDQLLGNTLALGRCADKGKSETGFVAAHHMAFETTEAVHRQHHG